MGCDSDVIKILWLVKNELRSPGYIKDARNSVNDLIEAVYNDESSIELYKFTDTSDDIVEVAQDIYEELVYDYK